MRCQRLLRIRDCGRESKEGIGCGPHFDENSPMGWHRPWMTVGFVLASGLGAASAQSPVMQSAALFEQMAAVLQHPRCMNCHTNTDFPRQGDDRHRHVANVARGPDGRGAAGLHCSTCHQAANQITSGVPGAADWHLAPLRMAWEGLSVPELCRALADPVRGAMTPDQWVAHIQTPLVVWAWSPGADAHARARSTPPLTHDAFVEITRRWVASGASCPKP
jgi:hypothetical protein